MPPHTHTSFLGYALRYAYLPPRLTRVCVKGSEEGKDEKDGGGDGSKQEKESAKQGII